MLADIADLPPRVLFLGVVEFSQTTHVDPISLIATPTHEFFLAHRAQDVSPTLELDHLLAQFIEGLSLCFILVTCITRAIFQTAICTIYPLSARLLSLLVHNVD